jgi:hypothetical protein
MTLGPRAIAAALVVLGIAISFTVADPPASPPARKGGFVVLAGDFHVHSFPGDGALPPWDIAREAARRRLDVVALTNHNSMLSSRLADRFTPAVGALLIPSQELTGVGFHMAAIGVDRTVEWRGTAAQAAAAIHAHGGLAIAAHPVGRSMDVFDAAAVAVLDGAEAAHPLMHADESGRKDLAAFYARATRQHPGLAAIGSTDYHSLAPIGLCRTYLFATSPGRDGVFEAIRAGRTVACDGAGTTYGPADLAALVADDCRAAATAPPAGSSSFDVISTCCVWFGLLALVVLGAENGR